MITKKKKGVADSCIQTGFIKLLSVLKKETPTLNHNKAYVYTYLTACPQTCLKNNEANASHF